MDFPRLRYQQAGASPEQLEQLEQQFDALGDAGQRAQLDRIAGISNYDLAEQLHADRQADDAGEPDGGSDSGPSGEAGETEQDPTAPGESK